MDAVGPGDYEPRTDWAKYRNAPIPSMKGADRNQLYRSMEKAGGQAPGPGYYNYRGAFDQFDDSDQTNMVVRLNAARKRLSASFESKTSRNAMLNAELKPKMGMPGPGAYTITAPVKGFGSPTKEGELTNQNFLSGGERFREDPNNNNNSAPGKYTLPSDFDKNKTKILKSKSLKNRSGWAQNISFDVTERRFFETSHAFAVPPPGAYSATNLDLASNVQKQNKRTPGFGSRTNRDFEASERNKTFVNAQEQLARELEGDIRHGIGPGGMSAKSKGSRSSSNMRPKGLKSNSAFGVGLKEGR